IISRSGEALNLLIEEMISPEVVPVKIANILTEKPLKYIIDFNLDNSKDIYSSLHPKDRCKDRCKEKDYYNQFGISEYITSISKKIISANNDFYASAQQKIDNKTKPLGSLGRLENLAVQMCIIQNSLNPSILRKSIFVFAGDHGVVEEGVSAYPAEVTGEMVDNFLNGGAAVNILAKCNNIDLTIIDAGVNKDFDVNPDLINKKISKGTRNFAVEKAMTRQEAIISIENGMNIFFEKYTKSPIDIIGLGEMGIGNTTSASAIISAVTGVSVKDVTGRGTGIDDKGIERKIETIEKALSFHNLESKNPLDILEKIGGYEIGGMVGTAIAAASKKTAIVLDGIISTAAGLLAYLINPLIKEYLISGHKSIEIGQMAALAFIGIEPALDLGMRLGEGTGAALTIHLVEVACSIMRDMASFEEANVSKKI
ncbi:MAG: nicotinate-nucleotide--dimethylbenzimidazole phosphoribosyltransferase, partial [Spirochaetota bacterium]|nr:nicotinate-nucleotide--dimethylbenzimidazole phosphoribosyltransferase [Spirochaetota bacterium]